MVAEDAGGARRAVGPLRAYAGLDCAEKKCFERSRRRWHPRPARRCTTASASCRSRTSAATTTSSSATASPAQPVTFPGEDTDAMAFWGIHAGRQRSPFLQSNVVVLERAGIRDL